MIWNWDGHGKRTSFRRNDLYKCPVKEGNAVSKEAEKAIVRVKKQWGTIGEFKAEKL